MRQPATSSVSAKWAKICAIDHLRGSGCRVNCFLVRGFVSLSSFLAVSCWTRSGSLPSMYPKMRWMYCCGVSCIISPVFQTHDDDLANEANDILFAARLSLASFFHVSTLS